jgi:hypothetical protein
MTEKKAKTALEIAEGNADKMDERKEYEVEDFKITPQEKVESHVINQDKATGFNADKKSGRFKDDKQSMSRIKNVFADGDEVVIQIDKSKLDLSIHAAVLVDQRISTKEATQRALMLNDLLRLDKVNLADRQQVQDIVQATIIAVLEAQENKMRKGGASYEDIKASRRKRLKRIHEFEAAVKDKRGQKALDQLTELTLFKDILEKVAH